jgi:hypothetical protein
MKYFFPSFPAGNNNQNFILFIYLFFRPDGSRTGCPTGARWDAQRVAKRGGQTGCQTGSDWVLDGGQTRCPTSGQTGCQTGCQMGPDGGQTGARRVARQGGQMGYPTGPDGVAGRGARQGLDGVPDGAKREPCHRPRHF